MSFVLATQKDKYHGNEAEKIDYYCVTERVFVERMILQLLWNYVEFILHDFGVLVVHF